MSATILDVSPDPRHGRGMIQVADSFMRTIFGSRFHCLVVAASLAAIGCGGGGDDSTSGPGTGGATSGTTGGATSGTSGGLTTGTTGTPTSTGTGEPTGTGTGAGTGSTGAVTGGSSGSTGSASEGTSSGSGSSSGEASPLSFFVTSDKSATGDLGGLAGADQRCQDLADAAGAGAKTWRAYLSAEKGPDDLPVHAKDRIGAGPWFNANGVMIASDLADLHTKDGDHTLFVDEYGEMINGQWADSPKPNEHDILTGSNVDGTLVAGKTCADWTSADPALFAQVGHSDGLGPMMNDAPMYRPWNSVHESGGCNDTAPKGGAGRIYCFAVD